MWSLSQREYAFLSHRSFKLPSFQAVPPPLTSPCVHFMEWTSPGHIAKTGLFLDFFFYEGEPDLIVFFSFSTFFPRSGRATLPRASL